MTWEIKKRQKPHRVPQNEEIVNKDCFQLNELCAVYVCVNGPFRWTYSMTDDFSVLLFPSHSPSLRIQQLFERDYFVEFSHISSGLTFDYLLFICNMGLQLSSWHDDLLLTVCLSVYKPKTNEMRKFV